jgi:hypothetical protein
LPARAGRNVEETAACHQRTPKKVKEGVPDNTDTPQTTGCKRFAVGYRRVTLFPV